MSERASGRGSDGSVYAPGKNEKVKNLLDAITEIEYCYTTEEKGSPLPERYFTTKQRVLFAEVGVKAALVSGLFTGLLTPVMMGVFEKLIPIFGSYSPGVVDQIYAFLLTIGFTIGYAFFIGQVGKFYIRKCRMTRIIINFLLGGLYGGSFLKAMFLFYFFHWIYFKLSPEVVGGWILKIMKWKIITLDPALLISAYNWIMEFRNVF